MTRNALKILGGVISLVAEAGASADSFPDGKVKHAIQIGAAVCASILFLKAHWPQKKAENVVSMPRPVV